MPSNFWQTIHQSLATGLVWLVDDRGEIHPMARERYAEIQKTYPGVTDTYAVYLVKEKAEAEAHKRRQWS